MSNSEKLEELRAKKPNLYRLACELASYENPDRVLNVLKSFLSANVKGGPEA